MVRTWAEETIDEYLERAERLTAESIGTSAAATAGGT
jgi:hypothetical protein